MCTPAPSESYTAHECLEVLVVLEVASFDTGSSQRIGAGQQDTTGAQRLQPSAQHRELLTITVQPESAEQQLNIRCALFGPSPDKTAGLGEIAAEHASLMIRISHLLVLVAGALHVGTPVR